jgi:hypothetical protein
MFGLDDGNVYLSVEKWHSSIVRLDGLDKVRRIDLGAVNATAEMIAAATPARVEEASKNAMHDEISVLSIQAKIDGDLSEWPAKSWATNNPKCSFQLGLEGDRACSGVSDRPMRTSRRSLSSRVDRSRPLTAARSTSRKSAIRYEPSLP